MCAPIVFIGAHKHLHTEFSPTIFLATLTVFSSNYILTLLISPNKPQDITCLGLCTCSYLCFKFFHLSAELQMPFKTHFTHQLFHEGVFESPSPTSSLGSRAGQWLCLLCLPSQHPVSLLLLTAPHCLSIRLGWDWSHLHLHLGMDGWA